MFFAGNCYTCRFAKKYILVLFSVWILLLIVFGLNLVAIGKSYSNYVIEQMHHNIYEYNEIDIEQLCRISNCSYVLRDKVVTQFIYIANHTSGSGRKIFRSVDGFVRYHHIIDNFYFSDSYDILLYLEKADVFFALDLNVFIEELKTTYLITFLLVYGIVFLFMYFSYKREEKDHILQTLGSEAVLSNQSMIMITENVHHELNTPLEVIDNKLEKVRRIIEEYIMSEFIIFENTDGFFLTPERIKLNHKMVVMNKDFEYIKMAIEQAYVVLDRMRGFKHLRYSNGNKTLYDICYGACKIITISNSGFEFDVDTELEDYKIKPSGSKTLRNIDLVNIVVNHLKNSLEAKSSTIIIKVASFNASKNILDIYIIDNGNGIPKEVQPKVFNANYSTKDSSSAIRGNGMYLNKFIMNSSGGDIRIVDSNQNGTIIGLTLSAIHEPRKTFI